MQTLPGVLIVTNTNTNPSVQDVSESGTNARYDNNVGAACMHGARVLLS